MLLLLVLQLLHGLLLCQNGALLLLIPLKLLLFNKLLLEKSLLNLLLLLSVLHLIPLINKLLELFFAHVKNLIKSSKYKTFEKFIRNSKNGWTVALRTRETTWCHMKHWRSWRDRCARVKNLWWTRTYFIISRISGWIWLFWKRIIVCLICWSTLLFSLWLEGTCITFTCYKRMFSSHHWCPTTIFI